MTEPQPPIPPQATESSFQPLSPDVQAAVAERSPELMEKKGDFWKPVEDKPKPKTQKHPPVQQGMPRKNHVLRNVLIFLLVSLAVGLVIRGTVFTVRAAQVSGNVRMSDEAILQEAGVTSAIVSLGGNVAAVGKKPDGSAWTVGLQDPDRPESYFGTVSIEAACVVTSGAYQRYFEENGVRYHHILDPYTGCPAESGVKSVSVIAQDDTLADALSTALFVMGLDAGAEFQKSSGLAFEAVFVTDDNTVWITPGLAGRYRSNRPYQILE